MKKKYINILFWLTILIISLVLFYSNYYTTIEGIDNITLGESSNIPLEKDPSGLPSNDADLKKFLATVFDKLNEYGGITITTDEAAINAADIAKSAADEDKAALNALNAATAVKQNADKELNSANSEVSRISRKTTEANKQRIYTRRDAAMAAVKTANYDKMKADENRSVTYYAKQTADADKTTADAEKRKADDNKDKPSDPKKDVTLCSKMVICCQIDIVLKEYLNSTIEEITATFPLSFQNSADVDLFRGMIYSSGSISKLLLKENYTEGKYPNFLNCKKPQNQEILNVLMPAYTTIYNTLRQFLYIKPNRNKIVYGGDKSNTQY